VNGDVVGNISLYDDYSIVFSFKYRVKDILVTICEKDKCEETQKEFNYGNNTVLNEAPYETLATVSYELKDSLVANSYDTIYLVKASADFKPTLSSTIGAILTVNKEITIEADTTNDSDSRESKIMQGIEKVKDVCNKWIIPAIYIVLAVVLLVKATFLCIDLIRYSDIPEIRSEKLKSFAYLGLVLILVSVLNTGLAFITGLFG